MLEENTKSSSSSSRCWKLPLSVPNVKEDDDGISIWPGIMMKELEGLLESKRLHPAIIVPAKETAKIRKQLKHVLMKRKKFKDVYPVSDNNQHERKLVLEHQSSSNNTDDNNNNNNNNVMNDAVFQDEVVANLLKDCNKDNQEQPLCRKSEQLICIGYKDLTVDQVLKRLLPCLGEDGAKKDNESSSSSSSWTPTSFETVGHVAHVNLRDDPNLMPFKYLIGQVILAKNYPNIRIVVNKTGIIDNVYRTFPMEVLASRPPPPSNNNNNKKPNTPTTQIQDSSKISYREGQICESLPITLREQGNLFHFDFCKVYWNSRLQAEHFRVVKLIVDTHKQQQKKHHPLIIADACAGVGPFAIPLAANYNNNKNKDLNIQVHANDLNPHSYQYLCHNQKLNSKKITNSNTTNNNTKASSSLTCYNMDARQFIRHLVTEKHIFPNHFIMNLPASAPELLTAFQGYPTTPTTTTTTHNDDDDEPTMSPQQPYVHVHCFAPKLKLNPQSHQQAIERCEKSLGCKLNLQTDNVSIHIVRDVSPTNNMLCISFQLPTAIHQLLPPQNDTTTNDNKSSSSSPSQLQSLPNMNNKKPRLS